MGYLEPGAHWEYVLAAYAAAAVIMTALVVFTLAASRRARRDLEALEARADARRRRGST
ncbi:MAG: heme exporter protein CcmD [Rhodobacteraceae bacterium]|nr:MAG: heme exporter protein CcmD [Paracoccaceae bacterium]